MPPAPTSHSTRYSGIWHFASAHQLKIAAQRVYLEGCSILGEDEESDIVQQHRHLGARLQVNVPPGAGTLTDISSSLYHTMLAHPWILAYQIFLFYDHVIFPGLHLEFRRSSSWDRFKAQSPDTDVLNTYPHPFQDNLCFDEGLLHFWSITNLGSGIYILNGHFLAYRFDSTKWGINHRRSDEEILRTHARIW